MVIVSLLVMSLDETMVPFTSQSKSRLHSSTKTILLTILSHCWQESRTNVLYIYVVFMCAPTWGWVFPILRLDGNCCLATGMKMSNRSDVEYSDPTTGKKHVFDLVFQISPFFTTIQTNPR